MIISYLVLYRLDWAGRIAYRTIVKDERQGSRRRRKLIRCQLIVRYYLYNSSLGGVLYTASGISYLILLVLLLYKLIHILTIMSLDMCKVHLLSWTVHEHDCAIFRLFIL